MLSSAIGYLFVCCFVGQKHLRQMLTHSIAFVGALPAASFAERINSKAGIISTKGNTSLSHEEISCLVPLRINKHVYAYLRHKLAPAEIEQEDS